MRVGGIRDIGAGRGAYLFFESELSRIMLLLRITETEEVTLKLNKRNLHVRERECE